MRHTTTVRCWQAQGGVEGVFDPMMATWNYRFDLTAFVEPLGDGEISTLFGDMRAEGARFFLGIDQPLLGYRWLLKDLETGRFYLIEPASPRYYVDILPHMEANARRLPVGPAGL